MLRIIYFQNKPLFICSEITSDIEEYLHHEDTVFIDEFNVHTVKAMIHEMEAPQIHAGVFLHENVDAVLSAFKKKMTLVLAAGGLVHTGKDEYLLIFRRGKWDLPKGKLDEGEELESCAIREVKEETGLKQVKSSGLLHITWHTYHENGKMILKESHWFSMTSPRQEELTPQVIEDIEKCEWVAAGQLDHYMENAHASVIEVIKAGTRKLQA